jgi:hypothetical protein
MAQFDDPIQKDPARFFGKFPATPSSECQPNIRRIFYALLLLSKNLEQINNVGKGSVQN